MSKIDERFCMGIFNNSLNIYTIFFFQKQTTRIFYNVERYFNKYKVESGG